MDSDKYKFYDIYAQSESGDFDIYVNDTTDLELAVAIARRYVDTHNTPCEICFNSNCAAIIVSRKP